MNAVASYGRFAWIMDMGQSALLLLIRLYIGYQCSLSGWRHLTHFNQTVDAFIGWQVPAPKLSVAVSGTMELVGGALLLIGLGARLISIPLAINFLVAILVANLSDPKYRKMLLHLWDNQDVVLKDDAFPFLAAAVLILFFGPGLFSIDGIIKHFKQRS